MPAVSYLQPVSQGVSLRVHVQPGARRSELAGTHGDALRVRIHAPPVDGQANAELCRLVAAVLGVGRAAVTVARGAGSRHKLLLVRGLDASAAAARLAAAPGGPP